MDRRILVPLDGSRRADSALRQLPELCNPADEITLLAVEKPGERQKIGESQPRALTRFASAGARLAPGRVTPVFETREQANERQLTRLYANLSLKADELQKLDFKVDIEVLLHKEPAKAIIEHARRVQPNLIVMVRRTHDPRRFIFGSVSSEVAKADVAPVLFLPAR